MTEDFPDDLPLMEHGGPYPPIPRALDPIQRCPCTGDAALIRNVLGQHAVSCFTCKAQTPFFAGKRRAVGVWNVMVGVCGGCGAETPAYPTELLARAAWNRMQRRDG